ncbi:uncharacterized protein LOC115742195 [Rhodamnia argentea]|uniref:Uncharacterized protein LOC115742195 n=1 Tax=Rhodamnia argentea TaxID=178133 RepID=A0A8B8PDR6_9MYRT|nr:uncharacterized protein LOC115742195 [Rhodamnia argentea]
MGDLQVVGGIKKLNNRSYNSWSTYMMSYMRGQDLWEVVNGNDTTVEEDVLEHIRDVDTPKEAWDTFAKLFSKKNDTKLQLLESELLSVTQRDMIVAQYFHKVKTLCREITELDPEAPIGDTRMNRIIIHGLKLEFRSFVAAIQGWKIQPSLVEFENLLAGQEALAKQMGGVSLQNEEEALYAYKDKWNSKQHAYGGSKTNDDKVRSHQGEGSIRSWNGSKNRGNGQKFEGKCYNRRKKGHMARIAGQKRRPSRVMLLLPKAKKDGMLRLSSL